MIDRENYSKLAEDQTQVWREYMAKEGVQQYRDYFEDAPEEQAFFEYLDNLSNRDQIRFMECFEDFTMVKSPNKTYVMIPRREFNPEISAFSNLLLDLIDFKDRVRPMANDIARHDAALLYQKKSVNEMQQQKSEFMEGIGSNEADDAASKAAQSVEEGYSSLEIAAESGAEEVDAAEADAAEPDLEAAAEQADEEKEDKKE